MQSFCECKGSSGFIDQEHTSHLDHSLSLAGAVHVCCLWIMKLDIGKTFGHNLPPTYCHATNKSSSCNAGLYYRDISSELILKDTELKILSTNERGLTYQKIYL
jgi:hypothetical protein